MTSIFKKNYTNYLGKIHLRQYCNFSFYIDLTKPTVFFTKSDNGRRILFQTASNFLKAFYL